MNKITATIIDSRSALTGEVQASGGLTALIVRTDQAQQEEGGGGGATPVTPFVISPPTVTTPLTAGDDAQGQTGTYGGSPTPSVTSRFWELEDPANTWTAIPSSNSLTLTGTGAYGGKRVRLKEVVENTSGTITGTSLPVVIEVAGVSPFVMTPPQIVRTSSGGQTDPIEAGDTVTMQPGSYGGTPAPTLVRRFWEIEVSPGVWNEAVGSNGLSYQTSTGQADQAIRPNEVYQNTEGQILGTGDPVTLEGVAVAAPTFDASPIASGTFTPEGMLTCTASAADATSLQYQWYRPVSGGPDVAIGSATLDTRSPAPADFWSGLYCRVTATNAGGSTSQDSNVVASKWMDDLNRLGAGSYLLVATEGLNTSTPNTAVSSWRDVTGAILPAQVITAAKPALKSAGSFVYVDFAGDDFLEGGLVPATAFHGDTQTCMVWTFAGIAGAGEALLSAGDADAASDWTWIERSRVNGPGGITRVYGGGIGSAPKPFWIQSTPTESVLYVNGAPFGNGAQSSVGGSPALDTFTLGARNSNGVVDLFLQNGLRAVAISPHAVTLADRDAIDASLAAKGV